MAQNENCNDETSVWTTLRIDKQRTTNLASILKVTVNASKSKDIIFSNNYLNNSPHLLLNNIHIERTNLHKHLTFYIIYIIFFG